MRAKGLSVDLEYLMMLVRGLCGPELPKQRFYWQRRFLSDLQQDEEDSAESGDTGAGLISVFDMEFDGEDEQIGMIQEEWNCRETTFEVAMAVGVGSYSLAVCCREGEAAIVMKRITVAQKATASGAGDSVNKKCLIGLTCTTA